MRDFRQLDIWRIRRMLVLQTYQATNAFPPQKAQSLKEVLRQRAVTLLGQITSGLEGNLSPEKAICLGKAAASAETMQNELNAAWTKGYLNTLMRDELLSSVARARNLLGARLAGEDRDEQEQEQEQE